MAARNRMPPWHENVRLSNRREILIRPIRPEDALTLRAGTEVAGELQASPALTVGPESADVATIALTPSTSARIEAETTRGISRSDTIK